jgi:hypothetical protein
MPNYPKAKQAIFNYLPGADVMHNQGNPSCPNNPAKAFSKFFSVNFIS